MSKKYFTGRKSPNKKRRNIEPVEEEKAVSLIANRDNGNRSHLMKVQLNHSLAVVDVGLGREPDARGEHVGITVRYLTEENDRLALANQRLASDLERFAAQLENRPGDEDRDAVYGESTEDKLFRLQKHLMSERKEKWSAIERSERTRVDLVNCERELSKSQQIAETLKKELEERKSQMEKLIEKLKRKKFNEEEKSSAEGQEERKESMTHFRAELKARREARQKALLAVSQELSTLREELQKEKSEKRRLEKELELRTEKAEKSSVEKLISDKASLQNEISILMENLDTAKESSRENIRLKFNIKRLNEELDELNSSLGELKFEYYEEKRRHERTVGRLKEAEEAKTREEQRRKEWEAEREKLFEKYDKEKEEIGKRTNALKEVVAITKQMLFIRENQVEELKNKLKVIEASVKGSPLVDERGLKAEYEKQLENIKHLRELYEERVRLMEAEREKLNENLKQKEKSMKDQEEEIQNLTNQIEVLKEEKKWERQEKESMERELRLMIARSKDLENELRLINNMFTQMLLGPYNSGNETDLDKLTELLQENHDLITEMTTREESSEIASVLPKLLLDLITQVDGVNEKKDDEPLEPDTCDTISEQSESLLADNQGAVLPILSYKDATLFKSLPEEQEHPDEKTTVKEEIKENDQISPTVQEIASNLPKVWRVLMELLSHHSAPEEPPPGDEKQCYKNVETPNGPRTVISVSKTFIRLKDLILEKKALQKELTRLKQLNSHLETRLDDQEKRLSQVQCELHKTWGIVGRMRTQHQQLHNHEKILRYELQEKRVMLSELKQELEYCRDKWERARQKNDESETEWKKLRREFAARKSKSYLLSNLNDSGESGFSDEQNESGEDFDADRSSTQSPIDEKLLDESSSTQTEGSNHKHPDVTTTEIFKQSEINLKQATEGVELTRLEECEEVSPTQMTGTVPKVKVSREEEMRERAREARDLRLKRLEEQCKLLVRQVDVTTHKSNYLNSRLEQLHEQYGNAEVGEKETESGTSNEGISPSGASRPEEEEAASGVGGRTETRRSEDEAEK